MIRKGQGADSNGLYELKLKSFWQVFRSESFAFWAICAYLFLEYVRPQSIYPFIDVLPWSQVAVIFAFLGCLHDKSINWVSSRVNGLVVVFFVLILSSSAFAYWPSLSFSNLENMYTWLIIYFLIINIVNSEQRFFIFISIFFLASFKLSLSLSITWAKRGFSFTDWGLSGPPGFFQNSGELAIQMLVYWPLALGFAKFLRSYVSNFKYYLLLLMPLTGIMVILGASSRGAQIALLAQLAFMNFRSIFKLRVLMSFLIILGAIWSILPDEQKKRFEFAGDDRTSVQRILYWQNGIEMLNDHPLTGVGYFNFIPYYERTYREDMLYEYAELPHNIFIQVGSDLGYLALFIYLLLILHVFLKTKTLGKYNSLQKPGELRLGLAKYLNVSLLGFLVAGQFVSVVYYPFLWVHLAFFVICERCLVKHKDSRIGRIYESKRLFKTRSS